MVLLVLLLPPQAQIPIATEAITSSGMEIDNSFRFVRLRQPAMGRSRSEKTVTAPLRAAVTLLLIVRVVVEAAVPLGVTLAGLNVQFELAGRPEHAKVVAALNPLRGVTLTMIAAGAPPVTDPLVGVIERLKSAAGRAFTVTASAADVEVEFLASPA